MIHVYTCMYTVRPLMSILVFSRKLLVYSVFFFPFFHFFFELVIKGSSDNPLSHATHMFTAVRYMYMYMKMLV